MRDFRQFGIWDDSMNLVTEVYRFIGYFPKNEIYGLRSQISRCAVSIPSNIAEGSSRNSEKDFKRFLEYAIGSAFELETQIILSMRLQLSDEKFATEILEKLEIIQKQINTLITKINKSIRDKSNK